jgi:hypothetical protein
LAYLENSNIIRTAISLSNGIRLKVEATAMPRSPVRR